MLEECEKGKVRAKCPICGQPKCTPLKQYNAETGESLTKCEMCRKNKQKRHGDIYVNKKTGYRYVYVDKDDLCYEDMSSNHYVAEQRYKMAHSLKRPLKKREIVYFKDGNNKNCDIDNLTLSKKLVKHELLRPEELVDVLFSYSDRDYDACFKLIMARVDERNLSNSRTRVQ